jgi:hypothetical protein
MLKRRHVMNAKFGWFLVSCLLILGLACTAFGQGMPMGPRHMPGNSERMPPPPPPFWRDAQLVRELGLTDDQIKSLDDLDYAFRKQQIALRTELEAAKLDLERADDDQASNDQAVLKAAQRVADLQGKMFMQHVEQKAKVRKTLSAEQNKIFKSLTPPPGPGAFGGPEGANPKRAPRSHADRDGKGTE